MDERRIFGVNLIRKVTYTERRIVNVWAQSAEEAEAKLRHAVRDIDGFADQPVWVRACSEVATSEIAVEGVIDACGLCLCLGAFTAANLEAIDIG